MRKCKIGEIADLCLGKMLDREKNKGKYEPYLANANVQWGRFELDDLPLMRFEEKEQERYGLKYGDIVMCEGGEPGRCAIWRNEVPNMKIQKALHRIRVADDSVDYRYLYYWFVIAGKQDLLKGNFIETTIKHLTGERLKEIEIELPSFAIQKKIGVWLETIDAKIESNRKSINVLEAMAKTIYDYWFVQFDFPDANGRPYKTSGGKMEWNETLSREIPAGWEVDNLFRIASYVNGLACQKYRPQGNEESLPVIKIRDMHEGVRTDTERVSANIPLENVIGDGDILFSWSATLEIQYWTGGKGGLNQHIFKVIPSEDFPKEYIYHQLKDYIVNFVKIAEARKTTMGHITQDHLKLSRIVIPPYEVLRRFEARIKPIHKQMVKCNQENRKLTYLRDFLLPMLMNGQVTFRQ